MSKVTLDSIRSAAEAKYGSTDIEIGDATVVLTNALRLSKERRNKLMSLQEDMKADGADQTELLREAIRTVCLHGETAELLLSEVGDDLAVLSLIFEQYGEGTQAGEA